ncbi:MAG: hypothetical protein KKF44_01295 [Nanoarchaeota archaeon]|nr:hypothetical protein [Nanoarchaeota archaeon]
MADNKIKWCLCQKKGISIIDCKNHLSEAYMQEADETLQNVMTTTGKWKLITAYYACYNALYSLLMKCGIKCEIHDCTLELMSLFEFTDAEKELLAKLKEDRIQVQYYLKSRTIHDIDDIKEFILRCKEILLDLNILKISKKREFLKSLGLNKGS